MTTRYLAVGTSELLGTSANATVALYESPAGSFRTAPCSSCSANETACGDGRDDDCDGQTDCADADCAGACSTCGDGVCDANEDPASCPEDCSDSCQCSEGPPGPQGPQGPPGPQGPIGPQGPPGVDLSAELADQRTLIDGLVALALQDGGPYSCVCDQAPCGNGAVSGVQNEVAANIPTPASILLYGAQRTGSEDTGWTCAHRDIHVCLCEGSCGNNAIGGDDGDIDTTVSGMRALTAYGIGRTGGADTGWICAVDTTYTCLCEGSCGNDAIGGDDGDIDTGISAISMFEDYSPHRTGFADTGWVCEPEGSHTCVCEGSCGNNAIGGSNGDIRTGLTAEEVLTSFAPQRTGSLATGWSCTIDQP